MPPSEKRTLLFPVVLSLGLCVAFAYFSGHRDRQQEGIGERQVHGPEAPPPGEPHRVLGLRASALLARCPDLRVVALAPDGKTMAWAHYVPESPCQITFWEMVTGRQWAAFRPHPRGGRALAFSPTGRTLASGGDETVTLWDSATGVQEVTLEGAPHVVVSVAYSPDGNTLAAARSDGTVTLWDVRTRRLRTVLLGHRRLALAVAFAPNGRTLASSGYDRTVRLWDLASGKELAILAGHGGPVRAIAYSADSQLLISGDDDGTARIWDVAGGHPRGELVGHSLGGVRSVAFASAGGLLATAGADGKVGLWDLASKTLRARLEGFPAIVLYVAFTPDGQALITASAGAPLADGEVRRWDLGAVLGAVAGSGG